MDVADGSVWALPVCKYVELFVKPMQEHFIQSRTSKWYLLTSATYVKLIFPYKISVSPTSVQKEE